MSARPLWTAGEAADAVRGEALGAWSVTGISIDTRTLEPGDLFVALRGDARDGHEFALEALRRGAAAVMVDHRPPGLDPDAPMLRVVDTQVALERLGRAGRARSEARVMAITGSVGKTGSKECAKFVLSRQAPTHASVASYNNHWGVPLSLARLPHGASFAVFEIGMNHAGEITRLVDQVRPHVALITAIAPAHLAQFGTIEAIADAKAEIFKGVVKGGSAVLNADDGQFARLRAHAVSEGIERIITFGYGDRAEARLLDMRLEPQGAWVEAELAKQRLSYRLDVPGRHWVSNSLGVLAAANELGANVSAAAAAMQDFRPPAGRGQRHTLRLSGGTCTLIDDAYNANPASMRAAIGVLGGMRGRRIAALGDMLELGEQSARLHAELTDVLAAYDIAKVFTAGTYMRELHEALPAHRRGAHAEDAASLLPKLRAQLRPGDVLLIKGSLGSRMVDLVSALLADAPADS